MTNHILLLLLLLSLPLTTPLLFSSPFSPPLTTTTTTTPISNIPIIICPGFGNDKIDYYTPLSQPREISLVAALERRGFDPTLITTIPIQRSDWLRVAGGLLDYRFYLNDARPEGYGYGWYLQRLKETVDEMYETSGGERVVLLGHSAGGWLARAAMGDGTWSSDDDVRTSERVRCLVTMGAIHRPPADVGRCVTRGALRYVDEMYPGAYLKGEGIGYVTVGGDAIRGRDETSAAPTTTAADELYERRGEGSAGRVAYTSYESVCGVGEVTGDGVVPLEWTQLEGARQVRLEGVLHSINEAGTTIPTDRWYGSEGVIDRWLPEVLREAGVNTAGDGKGAFDLGRVGKWATDLMSLVNTR